SRRDASSLLSLPGALPIFEVEICSGRDGSTMGWATSLSGARKPLGMWNGLDAGEPWPNDVFPTLCASEPGYGPYSYTLSAHIGRSEEHTSELQSREKLVCR